MDLSQNRTTGVVSWILVGAVLVVLICKLSRYGMRPKDYPPGNDCKFDPL